LKNGGVAEVLSFKLDQPSRLNCGLLQMGAVVCLLTAPLVKLFAGADNDDRM